MKEFCNTRKTPEDHCPHCGRMTDAVSDFYDQGESRRPKAGDVTVCIGCANWSVFGKDLKRHVPDEMEKLRVESSPIWQELDDYIKVIRQLHVERRAERE